jgi:hypothetical protein
MTARTVLPNRRVADCSFTSAELDTLRCLFLKGPTWDGNIPSKSGRDSLVDRDYAERDFGYAWLTRGGVEFCVKALEIDKSK